MEFIEEEIKGLIRDLSVRFNNCSRELKGDGCDKKLVDEGLVELLLMCMIAVRE